MLLTIITKSSSTILTVKELLRPYGTIESALNRKIGANYLSSMNKLINVLPSERMDEKQSKQCLDKLMLGFNRRNLRLCTRVITVHCCIRSMNNKWDRTQRDYC